MNDEQRLVMLEQALVGIIADYHRDMKHNDNTKADPATKWWACTAGRCRGMAGLLRTHPCPTCGAPLPAGAPPHASPAAPEGTHQ